MEETLELSQLEKLPPDALVAIISKLDPKSVIKVCSTSKTIDPWCLQEIHKYICGGKAKILV